MGTREGFTNEIVWGVWVKKGVYMQTNGCDWLNSDLIYENCRPHQLNGETERLNRTLIPWIPSPVTALATISDSLYKMGYSSYLL